MPAAAPRFESFSFYLDEPPAPDDPEPEDPEPEEPPMLPEEPELPPDEPPSMLPEPDEPELPESDEPELLGAQSPLDELLELDVPGGHGMALELPEVPLVLLVPLLSLLPLLPLLPDEPESIELPPDEPEPVYPPPDELELPLPVPVDDDWATARPAAAISANNNAQDDLRIMPPKMVIKKRTANCWQLQDLCHYFRRTS